MRAALICRDDEKKHKYADVRPWGGMLHVSPVLWLIRAVVECGELLHFIDGKEGGPAPSFPCPRNEQQESQEPVPL